MNKKEFFYGAQYNMNNMDKKRYYCHGSDCSICPIEKNCPINSLVDEKINIHILKEYKRYKILEILK